MQEMNANCNVIHMTSSRLSDTPKIFAIFTTITDIHRSHDSSLLTELRRSGHMWFIVNTRRLSFFCMSIITHIKRGQVISHQFWMMGMRRCNTFKF